tara:strand:- start:3486 stop:4541 length:1056 start_codon:yes stop_codon:yes gene_type:complete
MSKILKRPMFRRGGSTSTGIMDGFGESTRPNFKEGELVEQVEKEFGEPEMETGFDTQDYLSLAKLGFSVAGAPGGGPGLSGLMQAASPALQDFTDDLSGNRASRKEAFNTATKDRRDARLAAIGTEYEVANQADLEKKYQLEKASELRAVLLDDNATEAQKKAAVDDLDVLYPTRGKAKYEELAEARDTGYIKYEEDALSIFDILVAEDADTTSDEYIKLNEKYGGMTANEIAVQMAIESVLKQYEYADGGRVKKQMGGRINYANGGGPYEPGSGPNPDPGSPPIMQASSAGITFEELRSRLPAEVSDSIIKLLATSEAALFDFANIQTQEDIAQFNLKYNSDLQLPAQVA